MKAKSFRKLLKSRNRFYKKKHLAIPEDVTSVQAAVSNAVAKRGHKVYRDDRERCDRYLAKLFKKYDLTGTTSERFWYLTCLCQLIGPDPEIQKRMERNVKAKTKSRSKKRRHKHKRRR